MRFKKIEISAFRIYDKPEDATFDFAGPKGSAASFVSLYAPNGFGKTSFYDAVEWAITKNVSRFWQNKTLNSSINTQKENNAAQVKVLRNTNSSSKTKSYVKVTTEDGELPVRNLVTHGNKKADLENEDICENEDFRKVILSQEWISSFLKEVDGERRFNLFMKNPDLKDLNEYYRDVKGLIAANLTNIDGMEGKRASEIAKVVEVSENNLLELINNTIKELNEHQEELSAIKIDTSASDALAFANTVSTRLVEINKQLQQLNGNIERLNAIELGNESITGIAVYFENKARRQQIETDLTTVSALITKFEEFSKRQNELKTTQETHSDLLKALDDINRIAAAFGNYLRTEKSINEKTRQRDTEQKKRDELVQPLDKLIREESELKGRINAISANLIDTENKIVNFPTLKLAYESLQSSFKKSEEDIKAEKEKELKATEDKERLLNDLNIIEAQASAFSAKNYHAINVELAVFLKTLIEAIPQNYLALSKLEEQLKAINQEITQQVNYNQNLQDFIQTGLELIRVTQTKDCPFCDYTYENYQELAAKATNNPQLSSSGQSMVKLKNDTSEQITALTQKIAVDEKTITDFFNQLLGDIRQQIQSKELLIAEAKRNISALTRTQERHKKDIAQISSQLNGLELESYLQRLQQELGKLKAELQVQSNALHEVQAKMNPLREALQISQVKTGIFNDDIAKFEDENDYKIALQWIKESALEKQGDNKLITDKVNDLLSRINAKNDEIATLQKTIEQLTNELAEQNNKDVLNKQRVLKNEREALIKVLSAYEQLANATLAEDIKVMSIEQLEKQINEGKQTVENSRRSVEQKHTAFSKLQQYNANLYPFLQTAQAKAMVAKLNAEILFLREQVVPLLEEEKNKIKTHLEERVKSFFYTDLINQLYNKIDPHPDFKAVEFKANFDIDNPTLDVLVNDENKQKVLIPNLYFSTAQTNILSLSIFLASALNSKNYDCIFIDDPIQSMDSINLLSTIDLIRSIVVNEKKQVILSTHDSNFHNLLKRKMPPQLFNSKFLELESFGKVKSDNVN